MLKKLGLPVTLKKCVGLGLLVFGFLFVGASSASAVTLTLGAGTATSDGALTLKSTGATALTIAPVTTTNATGTIVIGATAGTGDITVGSSSVAQTLNLGTGAGVSTINVGTGAGENVITIGGASSGVTLGGTLAVTGATTFTGKITLGNNATAGILGGSGTLGQSTATSLGASGGKGMSYYLKTTSATASDALEGMYVTTYHGATATAVAPQGEAGRFRAFLVGDAAAGTVAGSHDTVEIGTGGTNTGLTIGTRGNVIFPNEVIGAAGTFAGVQAELNTGGAATNVSGTTTSILRLIIDGTAPTLAAQFTVPVMSVVIPSNLVGDGLIVDNTATNTAVAAKMRITVNGTTYWIPLAAADN